MLDIFSELNISRYNGGWSKKITGLDKSKNNGYSILGDFISINQGLNNLSDGIYLDNDKSGSRKNHTQNYSLFSILNGEIDLISFIPDGKNDWALHLWGDIENYFALPEISENLPLLEESKKIQMNLPFLSPGSGVPRRKKTAAQKKSLWDGKKQLSFSFL